MRIKAWIITRAPNRERFDTKRPRASRLKERKFADKDSLHVTFADEAVCIGPALSKDSYFLLSFDKHLPVPVPTCKT